MTNELEAFFCETWQACKTPLEQMYDIWTADTWEPGPEKATYRIWDKLGLPIRCHLEDCEDRWILEGLESQGIATVFVCDHGTQICGPHAAIRRVSSVPIARVARWDVANRPVE